jgi:hypothetical protein
VEGIKVGIEYSPVLKELARLGAVVSVLASDEGFLGIKSPDAEVACFILATLYTFELISLDFGGQGVDGGGEILDQVRVFHLHSACQKQYWHRTEHLIGPGGSQTRSNLNRAGLG